MRSLKIVNRFVLFIGPQGLYLYIQDSPTAIENRKVGCFFDRSPRPNVLSVVSELLVSRD